MSKAKKKGGATPAPAEPAEQPLEKVAISVADPEGMKVILQSPEATVTATACQHLFKHAEKGDKEKLFLFTHEIHTELAKHCLQHADKTTRYYAVMCLGSMAKKDEVLQALARNYDLPAMIVPLCATTEGLACQQYASFLVAVISNVNLYFAIQMWKGGAVPVIVPLLSVEDLDIKKNAIMALAALTGDSEARNDLLSENIIPVLLEFVASTYRDLQKYAIVALANLCGTAEFRELMRQSNVFDKLLGVFRNEKLEDLHIGSLNAMACIMRDRESFEMMFDNGDVQKVLDVMKESVGSSKKEVLDVVLKFLSALLHQDPTFAGKLYDMGIVPVCEKLMEHEDEVICSASCSVVGALCKYSMLICEKFAAEDSFFQHLISHMECETRAMRDSSTYCLVFALRSKQNCKKFIEAAGGVLSLEVLRRSIQETSFLAQKNALNATLQIMAHNEPDWNDSLLERGFVEAFLIVLGGGDRLFSLRHHISTHHRTQHADNLAVLGTRNRMRRKLFSYVSTRRARLVSGTDTFSSKPPKQKDVEVEELTQDNPYKQRLDVLPDDADPLIRKMLEVRQRSLLYIPRELMICAAACLGRFMTRAAGRQKLLAHPNGPGILARNLTMCHGDDRREERAELCQVIMHACVDYDVAQQFSEAGGLTGLYEVLASLPEELRPCSLATSAVTVILNHNPNMLYWMTGNLMCSHITQNGFYVLAQFKPVRASISQPIPTLETLSKAPCSNAITVYCANAVQPEPAKPSTPQLADIAENKTETSKERKESKASKSKKGRKSERDHYQREESVAEAKELEVVQRPVWTARPDNDLWLAIEEATMLIKAKNYPTSNLKMRQLALFVSSRMGGSVSEIDLRRGQLAHQEHIAELKAKLNSNVIPLGMVQCGTFLHRAVLLKVIADRLFLPCTLHRGNGYTAWNTFPCTEDTHFKGTKRTIYLVDLMFRPGALIKVDTPAAQRYMSFH